mmetsp:Transcript_18253/g.58858  ORF Transcript_18253/g.58858 Transcript_18253/m.58858 type:complete len:377 (+) Transcript_18253:2820-3950(+)
MRGRLSFQRTLRPQRIRESRAPGSGGTDDVPLGPAPSNEPRSVFVEAVAKYLTEKCGWTPRSQDSWPSSDPGQLYDFLVGTTENANHVLWEDSISLPKDAIATVASSFQESRASILAKAEELTTTLLERQFRSCDGQGASSGEIGFLLAHVLDQPLRGDTPIPGEIVEDPEGRYIILLDSMENFLGESLTESSYRPFGVRIKKLRAGRAAAEEARAKIAADDDPALTGPQSAEASSDIQTTEAVVPEEGNGQGTKARADTLHAGAPEALDQEMDTVLPPPSALPTSGRVAVRKGTKRKWQVADILGAATKGKVNNTKVHWDNSVAPSSNIHLDLANYGADKEVAGAWVLLAGKSSPTDVGEEANKVRTRSSATHQE